MYSYLLIGFGDTKRLKGVNVDHKCLKEFGKGAHSTINVVLQWCAATNPGIKCKEAKGSLILPNLGYYKEFLQCRGKD